MKRLRPFIWQTLDSKVAKDPSIILAWCFDENSERHLVRFEDFPTTMYVELPKIAGIRWNSGWVNNIVYYLNKKLKPHVIVESHFEDSARTLYHARVGENKYNPLMFLQFRNEEAKHKCVNILRRDLVILRGKEPISIKCTCLESDISNIRKFLTHVKLHYTEWFDVLLQEVVDEDEKISTIREYIGDFDTITALPEEECSPIPTFLAFDIECYSENHRAMPDKWKISDEIFMISCVYQKSKQKDTRKRYCITTCEMEDIKNVPLNEGEAEDKTPTEIIRVDNEITLLMRFCELVMKLDPDMVLGHNILQFDYVYMDARLKSEGLTWPQMGRLKEEKIIMISKNWESSAYGYVSLKYPSASGRIMGFDTLPYVKREHRLDNYDLSSVASKFIGKKKHDVTAQEMFAAFAESKAAEKSKDATRIQAAIKEMTRVGKYCIQDSDLVIELADALEAWISLNELSGIVDISIMELFTRGQQIRAISQLYHTAHSGSNVVLSYLEPMLVYFTGAYIHEPIPGIYEDVVCGDFQSLYPSILMAYNVCYTTYVPRELDDVIPDEDCNVFEFEQEEPLVVTRKVDDEIIDDSDAPEGFDNKETNLEKEKKKKKKKETHIVKYRFRFLKKTEDPASEGLIPRIVRGLVEKRAYVRDVLLKKEKVPLRRAILEARQLALKMCANSVYGFLGISKGAKYPLMQAALFVTAKGRELLMRVRKYIDETYPGASIIYGDTDSVMYKLPQITDRKMCRYWGERLCQEITGVKVGDPLPGTDPKSTNPEDKHKVAIKGLFKSPLALIYEKSMRILIFKKKKYASFYIDGEGEFKKIAVRGPGGVILHYLDKFEILKRGIVVARRDNCIALREIYQELLEMALLRKCFMDTFVKLIDFLQNLLEGNIPYKKLKVVKQLGSVYKSENNPMRLFSERLRKEGKQISPGDRLEFLIFKGESRYLGDRLCLLEQYELDTGKYEIDLNDYATRMMQKPLDQLISVAYSREILMLSDKVWYLAPRCRKKITIQKPIEMIMRSVRAGHSVSMWKENISKLINKLAVDDVVYGVQPVFQKQ